MDNDTIAKVAAGAAFLDQNYPGWEHHIDLGTLNLSLTTHCVLGQIGQVIGETMGCHITQKGFLQRWTDGVRGEGDTDGFTVISAMHQESIQAADNGLVSLGFDVDDHEAMSYKKAYAILDEAWIALIKERFSSGHLSDMKDDA